MAKKIIVGDGLDYLWDKDDLQAIAVLVEKGATAKEIEQHTKRDMLEVLIMLDHLIKEKIVSNVNHNLLPTRKRRKFNG